MADTRKKTADRLIENGCIWKEEVTISSHVGIAGEYDKDKYREKVKALRDQVIQLLLV